MCSCSRIMDLQQTVEKWSSILCQDVVKRTIRFTLALGFQAMLCPCNFTTTVEQGSGESASFAVSCRSFVQAEFLMRKLSMGPFFLTAGEPLCPPSPFLAFFAEAFRGVISADLFAPCPFCSELFCFVLGCDTVALTPGSSSFTCFVSCAELLQLTSGWSSFFTVPNEAHAEF